MAERLSLIDLDYEFREVRVLFLKDYNDLPLPNGRVSVRKGDEMDLPRWQAKLLAREGFVEVKDRSIDINDINMVHYRERKGSRGLSELQPLPQDFYYKVKEYIAFLNSKIRENPASMLIREREAAEKNVLDLADTRLAKIIRLAQTGSGEFKERLSPEEKILFDALNALIEDWRGYVKRAAVGGEG